MLNKKDARITALPMRPDIDFDKWFLPNPLIRKPKSGKSGTKYARFINRSFRIVPLLYTAAVLVIKSVTYACAYATSLVFKSIQEIDVYRMYIPIHHHNDG